MTVTFREDAGGAAAARIRLLTVLIDERLAEIREMAAKRRSLVLELRSAGWTLQQIGDACGMGRQRVSQIERSG